MCLAATCALQSDSALRKAFSATYMNVLGFMTTRVPKWQYQGLTVCGPSVTIKNKQVHTAINENLRCQ